MILGLDVSTACTGWCVLDMSGSLVSMGAIELSSIKNTYKKAKLVRDKMSSLLIDYNIKSVYIEENLQSFRSGFSSARTLSTLARFNGIVSLICYETFNLDPIHINVNHARRSLDIKIIRKKDGGQPTKAQILNWVSGEIDFLWPTKILKSGPRKGLKITKDTCYDMADAYVIARAGILECK